MLYQLPSGKTIEISTETYLRMSNEDFELYIAFNAGEELNDPFTNSVLRNGNKEILSDDEMEEFLSDAIIEEEEYIEDLTDILPDEKLYDEDFIDPDL